MAEQQPQVDSGSTKEEAGAAVPQQHKSAFVDFLQQLSSFSGDLRWVTLGWRVHVCVSMTRAVDQ